MGVPESDDPPAISDQESRQELFGRGPSKVGLESYELIAILLSSQPGTPRVRRWV
jgi:hypothetical protein